MAEENNDTGNGSEGKGGDQSQKSTETNTTTTETSNTGTGSGGEAKTFTQDELDKIVQREKGKTSRQAEKDAIAKIAEDLGVPIDEAKQLITDAKARQEAEKTEAQKAREAADAEKAKAEEAIAEARRETVKAKLTQALQTPGEDAEKEPAVLSESLAVAMELALPAAENSDLEGDEAVAAAVAHVRSIVPQIFVASDSGNNSTRTPGTPGRTNGERKTTSETPQDKAKATLEKFNKRQARPPVPRT